MIIFNFFTIFSVSEDERQLRLEIEDAAIHPGYAQEAYQDIAVITLKAPDSKLERGPRYYLDTSAFDIFGKSIPIRNFKKW